MDIERESARLAALDEEIEAASALLDYKGCERLQKKRDKLARRVKRASAKKDRRCSKRAGADATAPKGDWSQDRASTARLLPYEILRRDGVMRTAPGEYNVALRALDANYLGSRPDEQADVRAVFASYLDSVDPNVRIEFCLMTQHQDAADLMDSLIIDHVSGDDYGNVLRDELNAWCHNKITASSRSMKRSLGAVITVHAETLERAVPLLAHEAERFTRFMRDLQSDARVMSGDERLEDIRRYTRPDDPHGSVTFSMLEGAYGLTTRDLLAPSSVEHLSEERGVTRLRMGTRVVEAFTMRLDGWGKTMAHDFVSDLASLPFDMAISWHIQPWADAQATSVVERKLFSIETENNQYMMNNSRPERGYFVDEVNLPAPMKEAAVEAKGLRQDVMGDFHERLYSVTIAVVALGRDEKDLEAARKEIASVFSAHRRQVPESWAALSEQTFITALPIGMPRVPYERTLTTAPLARMVPFASSELFDRSGFLMGVNRATRNFIQYDPALREHSNSFILAAPRIGKSFNVKLTRIVQTRLRHPDDDVITFDPEREYADLITSLGGQTVNISESSNDHINPFDITELYASDTREARVNPIPSKVSFITTMVRMMASSIPDIEVNLLDQAVTLTYQRWSEHPCPENIPTLQDVYDWLRGEEVEPEMRPAAVRLASRFARFVSGSLSFFNHRTDVDIKSHMVDFVLSDLSLELKPLAMFIVLDNVWVRVAQNRRVGRRTWLIIDELQLLMEDERAMEKLNTFFSRGGKWDLYNCAIAQNAMRMLDYPSTRYMLQNTPFLTLLGQTADSANILADLLSLSESQERELRTAQPGEGLYILKSQVMSFDFKIDPAECPNLYAALTTRANDIKTMRAQSGAPGREDDMKIQAASHEYISPDGGYRKAVTGGVVELTEEETAHLIEREGAAFLERAMEIAGVAPASAALDTARAEASALAARVAQLEGIIHQLEAGEEPVDVAADPEPASEEPLAQAQAPAQKASNPEPAREPEEDPAQDPTLEMDIAEQVYDAMASAVADQVEPILEKRAAPERSPSTEPAEQSAPQGDGAADEAPVRENTQHKIEKPAMPAPRTMTSAAWRTDADKLAASAPTPIEYGMNDLAPIEMSLASKEGRQPDFEGDMTRAQFCWLVNNTGHTGVSAPTEEDAIDCAVAEAEAEGNQAEELYGDNLEEVDVDHYLLEVYTKRLAEAGYAVRRKS